MYDVMRGITIGNDNQLRADENAVAYTTGNNIDITPSGFKLKSVSGEINASNGQYVYVAIRRPDGYVGKPVEDATKVFAMDTGSGSSGLSLIHI